MIKITKNDVGRKVVLTGGEVFTITAISQENEPNCQVKLNGWYAMFGLGGAHEADDTIRIESFVDEQN